ncbi:protein disulfide-isomerase precursor [Dipsacomyces acuminosporus]|nr:protein disulfide-isomerase precursor [Dipsacomyces acuminosporus]
MKVNAMRFMLSTVAAMAVTAVASESSSSETAESDVKVLNTENFKEWTAAQELALIEFYAPWCGHCKQLAPHYEKAATTLKEDKIALAKVDCTEEQALCEEMQVPGFPTLKVFKNGDHATYNGTRQEAGIVSYMRKQRLPPLSTVTADAFEKFTKSDRLVVIGFIDDEKSSEHKELESLAKELRDEYTFGVVADKELAKKHGVTAPGVVVFKEFDDGKDAFDGKIVADDLRSFIKASSVPVLGEISAETYPMYAQAGLPFGFIFYDTAELRKELEKKFYPVAKENKGAISFVLIDATKYANQADHLNLKHEWPAFAIQNQTSFAKYPYPQDKEITEKDIRSFVKTFTEGKAKPSYKSEPIPKTNDGDVFVVVTNQFEEVVFDKSKDVLLEFYAPWCGHCKNLAPIYDRLGKALSKNKNLVVAKMDATANDVPSDLPALQVYGFPTIVLVRGEDNAVVEYKGNRSIESFVEFLEENAANKITYNKEDLKEEEEEEDEEEKKAEKKTEEKTEEKKAEEKKAEEKPKAEKKAEKKAEPAPAAAGDKDANHDEL